MKVKPLPLYDRIPKSAPQLPPRKRHKSLEIRLLAVEHLAYNIEGGDERNRSLIRLKGKWLARAGFLPGSKVRVEVEPGKMTITPQR
jgi:hypothetical protein